MVSTENDPLPNHREWEKQNAARLLKTRRRMVPRGRVPLIDHDGKQFSTIANQQIRWIETPFFQSLFQKFCDPRCPKSLPRNDLKNPRTGLLKIHSPMVGKEHPPTTEVP